MTGRVATETAARGVRAELAARVHDGGDVGDQQISLVAGADVTS